MDTPPECAMQNPLLCYTACKLELLPYLFYIDFVQSIYRLSLSKSSCVLVVLAGDVISTPQILDGILSIFACLRRFVLSTCFSVHRSPLPIRFRSFFIFFLAVNALLFLRMKYAKLRKQRNIVYFKLNLHTIFPDRDR